MNFLSFGDDIWCGEEALGISFPDFYVIVVDREAWASDLLSWRVICAFGSSVHQEFS